MPIRWQPTLGRPLRTTTRRRRRRGISTTATKATHCHQPHDCEPASGAATARPPVVKSRIFLPLGWFGIAVPELTSSMVELTGIRHFDLGQMHVFSPPTEHAAPSTIRDELALSLCRSGGVSLRLRPDCWRV